MHNPFNGFPGMGDENDEEEAQAESISLLEEELNNKRKDPVYGMSEQAASVVKEVSKLSVSKDEAVVVTLEKDADAELANNVLQAMKAMLQTENVLVFVGNVNITTVDMKNHRKHPLYDN